MAHELVVSLEDKPGTLAKLGETLGSAGVNIEGVCSVPSVGSAVIHLFVNDAGAARKAMQEAGLTIQAERPVLVLDLEDRPGELGQICSRISQAGININMVYLATNSRLVLGVDDFDRAHSLMR